MSRTNTISLSRYLRTMIRRLPIVILVAAGLSCALWAIIAQSGPLYRASASIELKDNPTSTVVEVSSIVRETVKAAAGKESECLVDIDTVHSRVVIRCEGDGKGECIEAVNGLVDSVGAKVAERDLTSNITVKHAENASDISLRANEMKYMPACILCSLIVGAMVASMLPSRRHSFQAADAQ